MKAIAGLLAHDLRNPLASIISNLGFLASKLDKDGRDALVDVELASFAIEQLAGHLEILADEPISQTGMSITALLTTRLKRFAFELEDRELHVALRDESMAATVCASRSSLSVILDVMVDNAVRYAPRQSTIHIHILPDGLSIRDEGQTMSPDLCRLAVTKNGQETLKRDGRYARGAGYYIAHLAAARMGGTLEVEARGIKLTGLSAEPP